MKRSLPFIVSMLFASSSLAEPGAAPKAAGALVDSELVVPLKKAEAKRARFSRAMPTPTERRVRVLDGSATDARGREFLRFAIDLRRPWSEHGGWQRDGLVGCVYLGSREVFVKVEDRYVPAKELLGRQGKAAPGVCVASAAPNTPEGSDPTTHAAS